MPHTAIPPRTCLRPAVVLLALLLPGVPAVQAADTPEPPRPAAQRPAADPLAAARARIAEKNFAAATEALAKARDTASADWHNLMGYALRNLPAPDYAAAEGHYREALRIAPQHRGAMEYLGELYIKTGRRAEAEALAASLARACPGGCPELDDLKAALAAAPAR